MCIRYTSAQSVAHGPTIRRHKSVYNYYYVILFVILYYYIMICDKQEWTPSPQNISCWVIISLRCYHCDVWVFVILLVVPSRTTDHKATIKDFNWFYGLGWRNCFLWAFVTCC